ncbi:MAG: hypothetical protein SGARI_007210, partial [Bacillariaceae sp.]
MSLREWVADKPLALAIHDAFFFGQTEDLDEDELSGLGFAEYLSKHWKRGGAAGAAELKEKLGDGYGPSSRHFSCCVLHLDLTCKLGQAALRKKFKTVEAYHAHMSSIAKLGQAGLRRNLGTEEAYHANQVALGKSLRKKFETEEAFHAHQSAAGKLGHARLKENLGTEEAYHEHHVAAGKASSASQRQKLGEEEYRKRLSKQLTKSQPDLSVSHPPGVSDATDYKVLDNLKGRFRYWKTKKGVESEQLKALMEPYREG